MDLLVLILIGIATIIISKDAYIEDKGASINEVIQNLGKSLPTEIEDVSVKQEDDLRQAFNLDQMNELEKIGGDI